MQADEDFCEDICAAAQSGNLELLRSCIEASSSYLINQNFVYESRKTSLLFLAAENGHTNVVKYLIEIGADVSIKSEMEIEDYGTLNAAAIFTAAYNGHLEVVQCLVEIGKASVGSVTASRTPLLFAACFHLPVAEYLLKKGAFVDVWNRRELTPLMFAASYGKAETVKLFLSKGADIKKYNYNGYTALHCASYYGRDNVIDVLLEAEAKIDAVDVYGRTPLYLACRNSHFSTVTLLMEKGADITIMTTRGHSLMTAAFEQKEPEAVQLIQALVNKNVDVNHKDLDGWSALQCASCYGNKAIVSLLIDLGADVNATNKYIRTALHQACWGGHLEIAVLLVEKGADINAEDNKKTTPLHEATIRKKKDVAEYLLGNNADVHTKDETGNTCLHTAARSGMNDIVDLMIKMGADVNVQNNLEETPLILACRRGQFDTVKVLVENGADIDISRPQHYVSNALMETVHSENDTVTEYLLKHGANMEKPNKFKMTALHLAAAYGPKSIVRLLLDYGANTEAVGNFGTPLHRACSQGRLDNVRLLVSGDLVDDLLDEGDWFFRMEVNKKLLLFCIKHLLKSIRSQMKGVKQEKRKVNVNALDSYQWTPLMCAAQKGHIEVVKFLLRHGANPNCSSRHGSTALTLAEDKHHLNVCYVLIQAGAKIRKNGRCVCRRIFTRFP